ncbi:MAG: hypothetical protein EVA89_13605 [Sandaracinaceae bacterium]|nr:MAG: hypothetical protein EVA89_13605 [Sandaracinaceae bacterium]
MSTRPMTCASHSAISTTSGPTGTCSPFASCVAALQHSHTVSAIWCRLRVSSAPPPPDSALEARSSMNASSSRCVPPLSLRSTSRACRSSAYAEGDRFKVTRLRSSSGRVGSLGRSPGVLPDVMRSICDAVLPSATSSHSPSVSASATRVSSRTAE